MGLRALVYITILALGLFGATGIGLFGPSGGANGLSPGVGIAAPLMQDNEDNGGDDDDDDDTDNGDNGEGDNGEGDNGDDDNGDDGDNGEDNEGVVATSPTPTPTPQPSQPSQPAPPQPTQPQPPIPSGPCEFKLGFKTLRDMIPTQVGNCVTNEMHNPVNGDALQITTGGLMAWRKADNWTAFTNGSITWLNGPCGLQSRPNEKKFPWEGQPGATCIPGEAV
jgi:hypothetical protein